MSSGKLSVHDAFMKRRFKNLALVLGTLWVSFSSESFAALQATKTFEEEQREVDALLSRMDSVALGKIAPQVLRFADRILKEKGDQAALRYYEKGLEGYPWALDQQLTLGEIKGRAGQPNVLLEKAEMVLRLGEDEEVLMRASRLAGRALPEKPMPFLEVSEPDTVLVIMPVGEVSIFMLRDLQEALAKRLGVKVVVASQAMQLPKAGRSMRTHWIERTRQFVLLNIEKNPELAARVKQLGFTFLQIQTDDEAFVSFLRKATEMEGGPNELAALDADLAKHENANQWEIVQLITSLRDSVKNQVSPKRLVLGVTSLDVYTGKSNYLFGMAEKGSFLGVISLHRFSGAFNDEAPKRERFRERILKQSLSTMGFMIGVERCNTPECARAYPQSLREHDLKPSTLCPTCRAGFEKALGSRLPTD